MAVNKVEINGETKLDLTQDTVTPETLLPGATAHSADGNAISGAAPVVRYDTAQSLSTAQQKQAQDNIGALAASAKGVAGGVASLDKNGKVLSSQLPEIPSVQYSTEDLTAGESPLADGVLYVVYE